MHTEQVTVYVCDICGRRDEDKGKIKRCEKFGLQPLPEPGWILYYHYFDDNGLFYEDHALIQKVVPVRVLSSRQKDHGWVAECEPAEAHLHGDVSWSNGKAEFPWTELDEEHDEDECVDFHCVVCG